MLRDEAKQFSYDRNAHLASASYDSLGNVTSQENRSYSWNLASQLLSVADPVNSTQLSYDGLGELSSSTVNGSTQSYLFNHAMKFPALSIIRQDGNDLRYFVYLPNGELLYSIEAASGERHFYHFDEMGNTVFLSDNAGSVTDTYAITPYGEIADHVGTTPSLFTWQGRYGAIQEGEGLYYLRTRHYDASTARFLSTDPIFSAEPQASELYAYAGGNPLLFTDPFGTDWWNPIQAIGDGLNAAGRATAAAAKAVADAAAAAAKVVTDAAASVASAVGADLKWAADQLKQQPKPQHVTLPSLPKASEPKPGLSVFEALPAVPLPPFKINSDGKVIGIDGTTYTLLITNDGGTLIASLITNDGGTLWSSAYAGIGSIPEWLASLITNDGGTLITNDGGTLITNDGGTVVSNDSAGFLSDNASGIRRLQSVESFCPVMTSKKNKK